VRVSTISLNSAVVAVHREDIRTAEPISEQKQFKGNKLGAQVNESKG
jgi:hypothetical protein